MCAQTPRARIEAAIAATRAAAAKEQPTNPSWKDFGPDLLAALDRAQAAAEAERLYLSVEELGRARVSLLANQSARQAATEGMAGFESAWTRSGAELTTKLQPASATAAGTPALVRALVEFAQFRSRTLHAAARAYADVTSPEAGFYYLGQAKADADFATVAPLFGLRTSSTPYPVRSIAREIASLQARVNDAFRPPRSIEKHPAFIRLNAVLKSATELNDAGLYFAALYHYVEASQQLWLLMNGEAAVPDPQKLREVISAAAGNYSQPGRDDSIAVLLVQRAQALLAAAQPDERSLPLAAAIAFDALPAYGGVLKQAVAPATSVARVMDVTLVRWPYT